MDFFHQAKDLLCYSVGKDSLCYSVIDASAPMYSPIMHKGIITRIHDLSIQRVIHDKPILHDFVGRLGFLADGL